MLAILLTLIPVFGIMFLGAVAHKQKVLPANAAACLNQFIYWYSLPMLLFYLMASVDMAHISVMPVLGCTLAMLLVQLISTVFLLWCKASWKESIVGGLTACFPNIAYMGIPIILLIYPQNDAAKAMAGMVALIPTVSLVLSDVLLSLDGKEKKNILGTIGNILQSLCKNPALLGATAGLIVGFGEIPVPQPLLHTAQMLGSASAPCALFCMGMSVSSQLSGWKSGMRIQWGQQSAMLAAKLFLSPLLVYFIATAFGASGVGLATMIILLSMPSAVICHIIAVKYNTFEDGCAQSVLLGTLASVLTVPLVIALVQKVG